jgi:hypothetical protein
MHGPPSTFRPAPPAPPSPSPDLVQKLDEVEAGFGALYGGCLARAYVTATLLPELSHEDLVSIGVPLGRAMAIVRTVSREAERASASTLGETTATEVRSHAVRAKWASAASSAHLEAREIRRHADAAQADACARLESSTSSHDALTAGPSVSVRAASAAACAFADGEYAVVSALVFGFAVSTFAATPSMLADLDAPTSSIIGSFLSLLSGVTLLSAFSTTFTALQKYYCKVLLARRPEALDVFLASTHCLSVQARRATWASLALYLASLAVLSFEIFARYDQSAAAWRLSLIVAVLTAGAGLVVFTYRSCAPPPHTRTRWPLPHPPDLTCTPPGRRAAVAVLPRRVCAANAVSNAYERATTVFAPPLTAGAGVASGAKLRRARISRRHLVHPEQDTSAVVGGARPS